MYIFIYIYVYIYIHVHNVKSEGARAREREREKTEESKLGSELEQTKHMRGDTATAKTPHSGIPPCGQGI